MTFSLTPRLGLPQWSDSGDAPSRLQFEAAFAALENLVVIYELGNSGSLPEPGGGNIGQIYVEGDTGAALMSNGSTWVSLGRVVLGTHVVRAIGNGGDNLAEFRDTSGNVTAWIDSVGVFHGGFRADSSGWLSPTAGFQPGWNNAPGYYYGMTQRLSGETAQVRGQVTYTAGSGSLVTTLDAAYIPLNTQRFSAYSAQTSANTVVVTLVGTKDADGDTPGRLYARDAATPPGVAIDINCVYLVGGLRVNGTLVT